jgi:transposase
MTDKKCISKLLKLTGLRVTGITFKGREKALYLCVKPYKNGCRCPECGRRGKIKRTMPDARKWRDVCVCGWIVFLLYCPKEIVCDTHGRVQEEIPWADAFARITYRLEYLVLVYSQLMTQKAAAELLHMARSTFSDILHRTIHRVRDGHRIRALKSVGIDEVSYRKGHKYVTVVYDLERACVVWVGPGKDRDAIDTFFNEMLSDYQKKQIQWACCDMSETYIGAIKDHCPNAKLVLDRFHIAKALNAAMDDVRKEQWREATGTERSALKGLRWLLFKHPSKRTQQDKRILETLRKGNRRIHRACVLKDEFDIFWNYSAPWAAKRFLKRWCTAALKSRLEPIRKFVRTIKKHTDNIITFIESGGITNAISEGLNRIIRMVKNRASGFQSVQAFIDLIYLTVGDVDIPAQIPVRFRTL